MFKENHPFNLGINGFHLYQIKLKIQITVNVQKVINVYYLEGLHRTVVFCHQMLLQAF